VTGPRAWEFGQLPMVLGPLIGLRAFRMTEDGLTGVHKQVPWGPGENVAECLATASDYAAWDGYCYGSYAAAIADWKPHVERAPFMHCSCGWYAYVDGSNTYLTTSRVAGLIEGYGHLVVGSRGFRAEKARIVALIQPGEMTYDEEFEWRSVCAAYPDAVTFTSVDEALARFPLTPVDLKAVSAVEKQAS